MKTKFIFLSLLFSILCFSQSSKTHYIPPLSNTTLYPTEDQYLYISCSSPTDITYRLTPIGGTPITGTVRRDNPQQVFIGSGSDTQILANGSNVSTILNNKGYIVEAEDLVYVTVRVMANNGNHAGGLVSKGLAALGTQFRIGALTNKDVPSNDSRHYTFASILATENNTTVSFSDLKPGITLLNNPGGTNPASITLNAGQSYILAAQGTGNIDRLIGSLISSNKPIAVNCGSFGGSNGNDSTSDLGFDQIVSAERTGKEYIFIKGEGSVNMIERPLIVAHHNNTQIFLNGSPTPITTINAGDYYTLDGTSFTAQDNLYIRTSENVFAYQGIGGGGGQPNQNLHFLPPLSCETPKVIDNIPFIDQIGGNTFTGNVCIVTETGANLTFLINGINHTLASLASLGITFSGPNNVTGNAGYVTYTFRGMTGNVSVYSTKSIYLSYYGSSGNATYGGFYSGFTYKPEIAFSKISTTSNNSCIPNVKLAVNSTSSFDTFQWFFNGNPITGAIASSYTPTVPGFYKVRGIISTCASAGALESEDIPVSSCPTNLDNDLANDNFDIDLENDGITNCTESLGNQNINTLVNSGTIPNSTTTYIASNTTTGTVSATPFTGNTDGSFITEIPAGKGFSVTYNLTFNQPTNIALEYPTTVNTTDLLNANAEYFVNSDINKTVTILNPTNQLLIDTNYDGIFESGVTEFSSFEVRFRLNGNIPLASGTGNFKLSSYQTRTFKITHKNLSNTEPNKSSFKIYASCVGKDTDGDGNPDQTDSDSDNDGILDTTEAQVNTTLPLSGTDTNKDGLDNAFEPGLTPVDTDTDTVKDYLDLDSDNDGILDKNEGIVDTDNDGIKNYRELDSDNDLCYDVKEAGFLDSNNDGILGSLTPPTINLNGQVTSGVGYSTPNNNYVIPAPIVITTQPQVNPTCELQKATITLADNGGNTYQWQISVDNGNTWANLSNNATYSGVTNQTLTINSVTMAMDGHKFRVQLKKTGNSCDLISTETTLKTLALPVVNSPISIVQCDSDLDAIAPINLTINNDLISSNYQNETFSYYRTPAAALTADVTQLIANPTAFINSSSPAAISVWARVENANGCFRTAQINAQVITTQIPATYIKTFSKCDDYVDNINNDRDGITTFDVSSVTTDLLTNVLPTGNYTIKYYRNTSDRDAQTNEITNPSNFRNDIPVNALNPFQTIWGRVDSSVSTACYGFARIDLIVEALPIINIINPYLDCEAKNGISDFDTTSLETDILGGQTNITITYFDASGNPLKDANGVLITSPFPATFSSPTQVITARLTNNTTNDPAGPCFDENKISFTTSNQATILPPTVVDLSDNNTITIHTTGNGDYVYSLDNPNGPYQTSNVFLNVFADIHTIYVKDLNGCGTSDREVYVLGLPKFFTPNGDGYHDTWNAKGISKVFNANTIIYIFDRFGKLLKQISPLGNGWDGTFNGQQLPADDYWYTVQFEDGRTAKGNFALKR